jgi:putative SOS response-associated peptidase YedK
MCYHYSIFRTADEIASRYDIVSRSVRINPDPVYHTSGFNHNSLPVVFKEHESTDIKLEFMQWGLVPGWVKGEEQAVKMRVSTLNARSETVDIKPSFRSAFRHRPCLVPSTGYFEWMHHQDRKYPFFIYIPSLPVFSLAGVWEEWIDRPTGEIRRTFSIITCEANELTAKIHNTKKRMPAILGTEDEKRWLDEKSDLSLRKSLLRPFDTSAMEAYTISRLITDRSRDSNVPRVIEPHSYPELDPLI